MIGFIKGRTASLKPSEVVVDVNGVGYVLSIPFTVYQKITLNSEVSLFVHTYVREDQLRLFGFLDENEKQIFEILIKVNGIGPSMAIAILSGIESADFLDAVRNSRSEILTRIPGIGKAKAEKIIFELSRKKNLFRDSASETSDSSSHRLDAIEALISLGYDSGRAAEAVNSSVAANPGAETEKIIKESLRRISGGKN